MDDDIIRIPLGPSPEDEESSILVPIDNWKCPRCGGPLSAICGKIDVGNHAADFVVEARCDQGTKCCVLQAFRVEVSADEDPTRYRQIKEALSFVLLNVK